MRLWKDNAFTMRATPDTFTIRSADGLNRRSFMGSGRTSFRGKLTMPLYPEQAPFLCAGVALTGSSTPSFVIDHLIQMEDASSTLYVKRYVGVKMEVFHLSGDADGQVMSLDLDLIAKKTDTTSYTDPAQSEYPTGTPYLFQMFNGGLTIGSARTEFSSFDMTIKNYLDATFNESQYVSRCKWSGRDIDWTNRLVFKSATDRTNFEALTPLAASATLTSGGHNIAFAMQANNVISKVDDDLKLPNVFYQQLSMANLIDNSAGTDFTMVGS